MEFRTKIPFNKKANNQIDYKSSILMFGSCFSENIGEKFAYFNFPVCINPFGILFHPKAIENLISNAIINKKYSENDIFSHNERWHSFDTHSKLSNPSKDNLLTSLNTNIKLTNNQISKSTHIIITLGTAWMYRFIKTNTIVANCHKIPQKQFLKEILSVEDISKSLASLVDNIKSINKNTSVIFTVSPVRHLKDGFIENQLSKSHLITAVHKVIDQKHNISYFPSYEIMMDELRDYRFYAKDMLHPNQTAINYIWIQFLKIWVSDSAQKTMTEVESIRKGLTHKPFNKDSEQHQEFLKNLKEKIVLLQKRIPDLNFNNVNELS